MNINKTIFYMKKLLGLLPLVALLLIASPSWSMEDGSDVLSIDYTMTVPSVDLIVPTLDVVTYVPSAPLTALVPSLESPDSALAEVYLNDDDVGWNDLYSTLIKSVGTERNDLPLLVPLKNDTSYDTLDTNDANGLKDLPLLVPLE